MNSTHEKLEALARTIMFRGITPEKLEEQWCYRKGKSFTDVKPAFEKGLKRGAGKLEREIMYAAFALDNILYPKKKPKKSIGTIREDATCNDW